MRCLGDITHNWLISEKMLHSFEKIDNFNVISKLINEIDKRKKDNKYGKNPI